MSAHPRHRAASWDQYQAIHAKVIASYSEHFIVQDDLVPEITDRGVLWIGSLQCVDRIEIHVWKLQEMSFRARGQLKVETLEYQYNVLRRDEAGAAQNLFRYDNAHAHPGHPDRHHRHTYDAAGGGTVTHLSAHGWGAGDWPTLGQVIAEAHEWWQNGTQLPTSIA